MGVEETLELKEDQWASSVLMEDHWASLVIKEDHWASLKLIVVHWASLVFGLKVSEPMAKEHFDGPEHGSYVIEELSGWLLLSTLLFSILFSFDLQELSAFPIQAYSVQIFVSRPFLALVLPSISLTLSFAFLIQKLAAFGQLSTVQQLSVIQHFSAIPELSAIPQSFTIQQFCVIPPIFVVQQLSAILQPFTIRYSSVAEQPSAVEQLSAIAQPSAIAQQPSAIHLPSSTPLLAFSVPLAS